MSDLYRQPAEQLTALEILRYVEKLEKQVAQMTVDNGRWRALAVAVLRAYEADDLFAMGRVAVQIKEESER
jgi:hypothetical protein